MPRGKEAITASFHLIVSAKRSRDLTRFPSTGLGKRWVPRLRESRLLTPGGASSCNLGTTLLPSLVQVGLFLSRIEPLSISLPKCTEQLGLPYCCTVTLDILCTNALLHRGLDCLCHLGFFFLRRRR